MNILLITCSLQPTSGWGTYSANTMRGLRDNGHTVHILTAEQSRKNVQAEVLPQPLSMLTSPFAWLHYALALRRAIRTHRPDVIHILVEPYAIAMPFVSFITRMPPWVMNLHGTYSVLPFTRFVSRFLFSFAFRQCAGFLVCSTFTYDKTCKAITAYASADILSHLERKKRFFRFGIVPSKFRSVRKNATTTKCILYVGGIKDRKGLREMIQGCAAFHRRSIVPIRIVLVGFYHPEDPYVRNLRRLIEESGMDEIVTFEGKVSEARREELYAEADVFMMLSKSDDVYFEGFGLVCIEASQRGIPVIGSYDSGCREAIDDGVSGYVVDAFNTELVADALTSILEMQNITTENCMEWASTHTMDQQNASCEMLYSDALNNHPLA